jgi:1-aminocyclopropane-1-carboxylate deaminase
MPLSVYSNLVLPSAVEQISHPLFSEKGVTISVKRDDLIHPVISGNKWRKLKPIVEKCITEKYAGILTFGGAFSNHIAATAAAGKLSGIPTIGIIRGDELNAESNPTMTRAKQDQMRLEFIERAAYDRRNDVKYHQELKKKFGNFLIVPEGGASYEGVLGAVEIVNELTDQYDAIVLPCGTGATAAGVLLGSSGTQVIGISVLKGGDFLLVEIERLLFECGLTSSDIKELLRDFSLKSNYHFGGYGSYDDALVAFMNEFYDQTGIPTDQIYTGKMFFALLDMVKKDRFPPGSKILAIHTGGLQGALSIRDQLSWSLPDLLTSAK